MYAYNYTDSNFAHEDTCLKRKQIHTVIINLFHADWNMQSSERLNCYMFQMENPNY